MGKQSKSELLAKRIACRSTELQRSYDLFIARRLALYRQIEAARIELVGLDAGIVQCRRRAVEQGYPAIL